MTPKNRDLTAGELSAMIDPGSGIAMDPNMITSSIMGGVEANAEDTTKKRVDAPTTPEDDVDAKGMVRWGDAPSYDNQYKRYPETCRIVGPQLAVYNITETEDLLKLNAMLLKQQPEDAPSILIANKKENFHEGKWLVLLEYYRVEYKQLIQTT